MGGQVLVRVQPAVVVLGLARGVVADALDGAAEGAGRARALGAVDEDPLQARKGPGGGPLLLLRVGDLLLLVGLGADRVVAAEDGEQLLGGDLGLGLALARIC